jgi:hypothetical protein
VERAAFHYERAMRVHTTMKVVVAATLVQLSIAGGGEFHSILEMGGQLKHIPVAAMMLFIIAFTISCEQLVRVIKLRLDYFNPLLHPCVDKIIAELMILGATAFGILLVNEFTGNGLANGDLMPQEWFYTLHWIDTIIFVFAIIFVVAACFLITLYDLFTSWLSWVDAGSKEDEREAEDSRYNTESAQVTQKMTRWQRYGECKLMQYTLVKQHFLKDQFGCHKENFDFVFYIEVVVALCSLVFNSPKKKHPACHNVKPITNYHVGVHHICHDRLL